VLFVLIVLPVANCALTFSKECGDLTCKEFTYCNPFTHLCENCSKICDKNSNNFDESRCVSDCQDYIHDQKYANKNQEMYESLAKDVLVLKILLGISIALTCISLGVTLAFFIYFLNIFRPKKPSSAEKYKSSEANKPSEPISTIYNNKYGLRSRDVTPPSLPNGTISNTSNTAASSPVRTEITTTGSSIQMQNFRREPFRREPSESTLPEYAYDNSSMAVSPSHRV